MLTPEQMGLVSPVQAGGPDSQPAGAANPDTALPADVMEAPAFAFGESHAPDPAPSAPDVQVNGTTLPASWLTPGAAPAGVAAPTTSAGGPGSQQTVWDSDQNPYKREAEQLRQSQPSPAAQAQQILQALPALEQQTVAYYMSQGYDEAHARTLANADARVARAEMTTIINNQATAPAARQLVAEDIAKRFSLPGHQIDPKLLLSERTVAGMEARARTLVETGRTRAVTQRAAARPDTVENSNGITGGSQVAASALNAFETIRSGLRQYNRRPAGARG